VIEQQNHPLYPVDRIRINQLIATQVPNESDFVDLARLLKRYRDFPGANDLQEDMIKVLSFWDMTEESLNIKTKEIWTNGYRPGNNSAEVVGSGFDTSDISSS
tara:strand:- start:32 stop:340 length:309 start_codon:yes stop_codon:yes gene_type:complete